jgi:hypothetical protein
VPRKKLARSGNGGMIEKAISAVTRTSDNTLLQGDGVSSPILGDNPCRGTLGG